MEHAVVGMNGACGSWNEWSMRYLE